MKIASKKCRIFLLIATFAALIICSTFALITMKTFTASADSLTLTSFKTLDGAQVRLSDTSGIRFRNSISKADYDSLIAEYGEENVEFGTVFAHKASLGENALTLETCGTSVKRTTWSKDYNPTLGTDTYVYNAVLVNLLEDNYTREYVVLGYVTVTSGGTSTTYYSTPENVGGNVRSPIYVATAAASNGETGEFLDLIIYKSIENCTDSDLSINLTDTELSLGETAEISATLNGVAVNPVFTVTAGDGAVTLDKGVITSVGAGTAEITATLSATYGGNTKTLTATATVSTSLSLTADKDIVTVSEELTDATVKYNGASIGTFTGTTFNAVEMLSGSGNIAAGANSYALTVEAKGGRTAEISVTYTGLNNTNFATTVNTSNTDVYASTYYVLTEDITEFGECRKTNGWNNNYVFDAFYGVLDGQGYKITISEKYTYYQTNCGLFFQVFGTIKNLRYETTAYTDYTVNNHGLFVCVMQNGSSLINSYVKVDYNGHTGKNPAAISATYGNPNAVIVENCIFEVKGNSSAVAFGPNANGTSYFRNCVMIRESSTQNFITAGAGTRLFGTDTESISTYIYNSYADFIGGNNGEFISGRYAANAAITAQTADEGTHYDLFTGVWAIDAESNTIKLCGKTAYEPVAITLSADKDIVTVSEKVKAANVKYNGEVIGTFTGTTFNAVEMLSNSGKIALGENSYTLTVEAAGYVLQGEGVTVTYTGLNNENFATTVNASSTAAYSSTYYVLMEDITELGTQTATLWNVPYVYNIFYGILDGQGYKITKTADYTTTVGLFAQLFGTFKNLQVDITVGYNHGANRGAFVGATQAGSIIENCYVKVDYNSKNITAGGADTAPGNAAVIFQMATTTIKNCIFDVSGGTNVALFGLGAGGTTYITDCILIRESSSQPFALTVTVSANRVLKGCYVYASNADFIGGVNGYAVEDGTYGQNAAIAVGTEPVGTEETPVTNYSTFTDVWAIDAESNTIALCGKTAYSAS